MTKFLATIALGAASLGLIAPPASATALGGNDADKQIAEAGVFQADDFPAGWRATPHKKSKTDPDECPALKKVARETRKNKTADVDSDDFKRRDDQYLSSVVVYRTEDATRRAYEAAASRAMRRCLTRLVKDEVEKVAEDENLGDVKVESGTVTGTGSYGDESSDIALTVTASTGGLEQERFADALFVRVGRALAVYVRDSTSEPSEFDEPTFDGLVRSATGRLTVAQGGQPGTTGGGTARPRAEVRVLVYNAGAASGTAGNMTNQLRTLGYQLAPSSNATLRTGTAVACKQGYESEAAQLQGDVGAGTTVEPFPNPGPPGSENENCIVLLGT